MLSSADLCARSVILPLGLRIWTVWKSHGGYDEATVWIHLTASCWDCRLAISFLLGMNLRILCQRGQTEPFASLRPVQAQNQSP